jgi:hypothetical protein
MVTFHTNSKLYYQVIPESVNKLCMYSKKYDYCINFRFLLQPENRDIRLHRNVCTYLIHYMALYLDGRHAGFQVHVGIEIVVSFKHVRYCS